MRIKRGLIKKKKHNKILKLVKGYRLSYSKSYKRAKEAILHAGQYSFAHRRRRGSQMRKLWIQRINGGLTSHKMKYNIFIHTLETKKIELNRKMLAEIALNHPTVFTKIVETVK